LGLLPWIAPTILLLLLLLLAIFGDFWCVGIDTWCVSTPQPGVTQHHLDVVLLPGPKVKGE
jgi:hypothetical protein